MAPPPDALPPGTPLTVGLHQVVIDKYISEGGFARVYACTIDPPFNGNATACLKRVVVPNKWQLTLLRQEVDAMKRLRGNSHIVSYIDSHASRLASGVAHPQVLHAAQAQQYEVLLLMEYCLGKGLIDFMNTRLTHRLTEPEILLIMAQITTAVAMCHHLTPPLIHRDIKIENVLIDGSGKYKLCDFGSSVEYLPVPGSQAELAALHNDIMQNTTPQYRAPEMIELARGFPIDDKLDIWALGVFLYKLCFYTTPFELPQQKLLNDLHAAILSCTSTLRFPGSPQFSPRLQNVIHCCLREDPRRRPNALQLLQEICLMQGVATIPEVVPYAVRLARENTAHKAEPVLEKRPALPARRSAGKVAEKAATVPYAGTKVSTVPTVKLATNLAAAKVDAFAKIDKSKILQMGQKPPRPQLEIYPSRSAASVQDALRSHVHHDLSVPPTRARKSEDSQRDSTLDFLRAKDADLKAASRQNTGGSFKASLKNGLRRISTGGSLSGQRSGSFTLHKSGHYEKPLSSGDETLHVPEKKPEIKRSGSIQRRMQQLLSNKDKKTPKTASGYGKYTEQDDISAINHSISAHPSTDSLPSKVAEVPQKYQFLLKSGTKSTPGKGSSAHSRPGLARLASTKNPGADTTRTLPKIRLSAETSKKTHDLPPPCPPSLSVRNSSLSLDPYLQRISGNAKAKDGPKKKPPPKPVKPKHLKEPSANKSNENRRLSTSSEVSMPDLDDLEKQFARRFPSYV